MPAAITGGSYLLRDGTLLLRNIYYVAEPCHNGPIIFTKIYINMYLTNPLLPDQV